MTESTARFNLSGSIVGVLLGSALVALMLYISGRHDYVQLHTILDTAMLLLTVVLALLLWDMGRRSDSAFPTNLAVCFAVASLLSLIHVGVSVEWSGPLQPISDAQAVLRLGTWAPTSYALPLGIACAIWLMTRNRRCTGILALGLIVLSAALFILFNKLQRYSPPGWLGITRPTLILAPPLWAVVTVLCWRWRTRHRLVPLLLMIAPILLLENVAQLYSRGTHDTETMIAHVGRDCAYLVLLVSLMQLAASDIRERERAERELAQLNHELEERVEERTAELARANRSLEEENKVRRAAETDLLYERDLFRTLLDNLPDPIYFKDLESRFVRVSRVKLEKSYATYLARHCAAHADAELPPHLASIEAFSEFLTGKSDYDFFNDDDARMVHEEEREVMQSGKPIVSRLEKVLDREGNEAWFLSTKVPWKDKDGNTIGILGTSKDVTALKKTEHALRESIENYKRAEAKIHAQLSRLNLLEHITRAIGERQDLKSIFQVVVRSLEDNMPADFSCVCLRDQTDNTVKVVAVGVKSAPTAMELAMAEHSTIPVDENGLSRCLTGRLVYEPDISAVPFPFPQRLARGGLKALVIAPLAVESNIFGVLIAARREANSFSSGDCEFLRQLSEHVALASHHSQLYSALQQAYDDLRQSQQTVMQQERLRALGQMASGIAHDINNAISPVSLYTQSLLEREENLSERARNYLKTIKQAVDDVAETVSRMREFYRQREPQLTLAALNLSRLVEQVIELTHARWSDMPQQRGLVVKLEKELSPNLPQVRGVESEIRDALTNLVFNALDAMPDGGTLTVRTRVSGDGSSRRVHVEVADTGVGMDEDTRRRCLEPFFTTKGERGTGLGLAMVYGMAKRHGAELEIESAVGKGTTMRLAFAVAAPVAASPEQTPQITDAPSRLRILVVDDDPLLLKSLRDTLEDDGHVVTTANGGQTGIEAFRSSCDGGPKFSVVITDLGMPYVDGRKVAAEIKRLSPSTPVILLTGWGQRLVEEKDIPNHVDRVLSKPPALQQLREALARCCSKN